MLNIGHKKFLGSCVQCIARIQSQYFKGRKVWCLIKVYIKQMQFFTKFQVFGNNFKLIQKEKKNHFLENLWSQLFIALYHNGIIPASHSYGRLSRMQSKRKSGLEEKPVPRKHIEVTLWNTFLATLMAINILMLHILGSVNFILQQLYSEPSYQKAQ